MHTEFLEDDGKSGAGEQAQRRAGDVLLLLSCSFSGGSAIRKAMSSEWTEAKRRMDQMLNKKGADASGYRAISRLWASPKKGASPMATQENQQETRDNRSDHIS